MPRFRLPRHFNENGGDYSNAWLDLMTTEKAVDDLVDDIYSHYSYTKRLHINKWSRFDFYIQFPATIHPSDSIRNPKAKWESGVERWSPNGNETTNDKLAAIFQERYAAIDKFADYNKTELKDLLDLVRRRKISAEMACDRAKDIWIGFFMGGGAPIGSENNLWISGIWANSAQFNLTTRSANSFADYCD